MSMPLGPGEGTAAHTTATRESHGDHIQKYESKVVAPKNPKLVRKPNSQTQFVSCIIGSAIRLLILMLTVLTRSVHDLFLKEGLYLSVKKLRTF